MRFDYETKQDDRECVAYIDEDGDLVIKENSNGCSLHPLFRKNGDVGVSPWVESLAVHKFYPGDKLTITF